MPTSAEKRAAQEVRAIVRYSLPGAKKTGREHVGRAEKIAIHIYRRFNVMPHGWRQKHLCWVRDRLLCENAPTTRYNYYRTVVKVAHGIGRPHIVPLGDWSTPQGILRTSEPNHVGRPMRVPREQYGGSRLKEAHDHALAAIEELWEAAEASGDEDRREQARLAWFTL